MTSPAMAALEATMAAMSNVAYIRSCFAMPRKTSPTIYTKPTVNSNVAMVMPETGEFDEPTTPAMYPATAAKKKATKARKSAPAIARMNDSVAHQ